MKIRFNLNAAVRLEDIEISGKSEEEIIKKLHDSSIADLLRDYGAYERDDDYTDLESKVVESEITAKVADIKYDVDEDDLFGTEYNSLEELTDNLPSTLEVTTYVDNENENEEDAIRDEIYARVGFDPKSFKFKITKRQ